LIGLAIDQARNIPISLAEKMRKPLKDKLLLKGLKRGSLKSLNPHSHTSIFYGTIPAKNPKVILK
jgi:hypothetical protein